MAICKKCGSGLSFTKIDGKFHPRNLDGSDHFDLCRDIQNKQFIEKGKAFNIKAGNGYDLKEKRRFMLIRGKKITGKYYKFTPIEEGKVPF